ADAIVRDIVDVAKTRELGGKVLRALEATEGHPIAQRLVALGEYLRRPDARSIPAETRHAIARVSERAKVTLEDIPSLWAEILTDRALVRAAFAEHAPEQFTDREIDWALGHSGRRCGAALAHREGLADAPEAPADG